MDTSSSSSTPSPLMHTHALDSQVGGHAGVLTTEDGSLLIKPALQRELAFYTALQRDEGLQELRGFTPQFLGTLRLEGRVDPAAVQAQAPGEAGADAAAAGLVVQPFPSFLGENGHEDVNGESIVLENLSFPFLKPNILDIKLGTVLYDDTAPPDKVARMEKTARETTSFETGIRLTGFQVYDNTTSLPVNTPKTYGKSIKPHQLAEGIARFFPLGTPVPSSEADASASPPSSSLGLGSGASSGLPLKTLIPVLHAVREEVALIREIFASLEIRMVGGSLLIVYEADWGRAEEGIKRYLANEDEDEEDEEEEEEEEEDDDDDDETKPKRPGPPFVVKLIDFAHTSFVPGQGPDEGVLKGMDTVVRLLDGRIKELSP